MLSNQLDQKWYQKISNVSNSSWEADPHLDDHELEVALPDGVGVLSGEAVPLGEDVADGLLAAEARQDPLRSPRVHFRFLVVY